jgi:DnaK suppressor protein
VDLKRARKRLDARLAELDHSSAVLSGEGAGLGSGDLSHIHQHPGDQGTDISDADREGAVLEAAAADRAQIEQALERIENGSYGRCIDCGKPIPAGRLAARPEVERCVADQQRFEAGRT